MSILNRSVPQSNPSPDPDRPRPSWPSDSDEAFWARRTAYDDHNEAEAFRELMTCASDLGHLPSSEEFDAWRTGMPSDSELFTREHGVFPDEPYPGEPPMIDESAYFDPDEDFEPFDDGPIFEPTEEDLDWLRSQRDDCLEHPATLAELDRDIATLESRLRTV